MNDEKTIPWKEEQKFHIHRTFGNRTVVYSVVYTTGITKRVNLQLPGRRSATPKELISEGWKIMRPEEQRVHHG